MVSACSRKYKMMHRQNVYMKQELKNDLHVIVEVLMAGSANSSDASLSAVCSEMMAPGIQTYARIKNPPGPSIDSVEACLNKRPDD